MSGSMPIRVMLADDNAVFRAGKSSSPVLGD